MGPKLRVTSFAVVDRRLAVVSAILQLKEARILASKLCQRRKRRREVGYGKPGAAFNFGGGVQGSLNL